MKTYALLIFYILILSACDKTKVSVSIPDKNYSGTWIVSSVISPAENDPALVSMNKFYKGRWIQYNKNKTYTTNINGQYDHGTYEVTNGQHDSVLMKSFRGDKYYIASNYDNEGVGTIKHTISVPEMTGTQSYEIKCNVRFYKYRDSGMDPYDIINNKWRLPAEKSESDSLLTERLVNHIDFWLAYLNTADKLEVSRFDYSNLNTCFTFAAYGVQVQNYKKWENSFKSLFYSREEAERAFKLLSKAVYKSEFIKNDNAYLQGRNLFTQIKYHLTHPASK